MFFSEGFGGFEEAFGGMGGGRRPKKEEKPIDNTGFYKLLGVEKDATKSQLKKAFFKLARKNHPDKGGDAKVFQEISQAYDVLKDEDKRAAYDKYGKEGILEGRSGTQPQGFGDIFDMFGGGGGRRRKQQGMKKAKGMLKEMRITLEDSYNGGMKSFEFERYRICETCDGKGGEGVEKCKPCKGKGTIEKVMQFGPGMYQHISQQCPKCDGKGKTIKTKCKDCKSQKIVNKKVTQEVPIIRGVYNEYDYIMTGEGHEAPGVMAGDLHVRFLLEDHKVFERKGADLFVKKKISLLQALTGVSFTLTHLDGKKIHIATMPGEVICHSQLKMIRNQGMPFFEDEMNQGHLFIKFEIEFPKKGSLSKKQIKLLRNLLPGPKGQDIDYKSNKYEILDEYDQSDFNPKATGERSSHRSQDDDEHMQGGQRVQCQQ